jgi:hypothetical protein
VTASAAGAPTSGVTTTQALATKLGCTLDGADNVNSGDGSSAKNSCHVANGHQVVFAIFVSKNARDGYVNEGKAIFPGAHFVIGDGWCAGGPAATAQDLAPLG